MFFFHSEERLRALRTQHTRSLTHTMCTGTHWLTLRTASFFTIAHLIKRINTTYTSEHFWIPSVIHPSRRRGSRGWLQLMEGGWETEGRGCKRQGAGRRSEAEQEECEHIYICPCACVWLVCVGVCVCVLSRVSKYLHHFSNNDHRLIHPPTIIHTRTPIAE